MKFYLFFKRFIVQKITWLKIVMHLKSTSSVQNNFPCCEQNNYLHEVESYLRS